jgi:uncharacterized LabA/DUF88 family protein
MSSARRWMLFVDGENLLFRASKFVDDRGYRFVDNEFSQPGCFVWPRDLLHMYIQETRAKPGRLLIEHQCVQAHYCTSVTGGSEAVGNASAKLWRLGFTPHVFHKDKQSQRSKGVDITLTTLMLGHAFRDNYDVAVLVTGDADFAPLVKEVRREGKAVHLWSFDVDNGLSEKFKHECDTFDDMEQFGNLFINPCSQPKPKPQVATIPEAE